MKIKRILLKFLRGLRIRIVILFRLVCTLGSQHSTVPERDDGGLRFDKSDDAELTQSDNLTNEQKKK